MPLPTYFGSGAFGASTTTLAPTFPASTQADDIAILVGESENQAITLSTPQGFAEVLNSPQGTGSAGVAGSTRLSAFVKRLVGGDTAPTIADPGDHITGQIHVFRGCRKIDFLAADSFDRANENPLGNGVWSTITGQVAMQIVGNVATPTNVTTTDDGSRYSGIAWPNDQSSKAALSCTGTNGGGAGVALYVLLSTKRRRQIAGALDVTFA